MVDTELSEDKLITMPVSTLVQIIMSLNESCQELNRKLTIAEEQIAIMNQRVYGRKSEAAVSPLQLQLDLGLNEAEVLAEEKEEEPQLEEAAPRKKKAAGKKKEDWKKITNHREEYITLSEEELNEKYGEGKWKRLPDEIVCQLEHHPASFEAVTYHIAVYAKNDNQTIVRAPKPLQLFSKSIATPSLVAGIMNAKYVNAIPLYRLEAAYRQNDVNISRGVMANWMIQSADLYLRYYYDALKQEMMKQSLLHADETPFEGIRDGRPAGSKSYMWVYRTDAKAAGGKAILYEYCPTRGHQNPEEFLKEYTGTLVCDGYGAYHQLEREHPGKFRVAGCWVHCKRKFSTILKTDEKKYKGTLADKAVKKIQKIYHEEHRLENLPADEHLQKRQEIIQPLVDDFFQWIRSKRNLVDSSSAIGEAFTYALNQERYLRVFLDDPTVPLDNNAAEIAIRPFTIGRKNWVLIDTPKGAEASAIIYSIVETAKANNLKTYPYLTWLLEKIAQRANEGITTIPEELLPWSLKIPASLKK